jgi:hypothetical protein
MATPTPPNFDDLEARLRAAGVTDEVSLRAALERDPQLAQDLFAAQMAAMLQAFAAVQDPEQLRALWQQVPAELEGPFIETVEALIGQAQASGNTDAAEDLRAKLADFKRLREAAARERSLLRALQAFIGADTWGKSQQVVEAHPELLGDEALATLNRLIAAARTQGDEAGTRILLEHRDLLRRCREVGIPAAFAERRHPPEVPPHFRADLERAQAAAQRYPRTGDRAALDEAAAAWAAILNHPSFVAADGRFRRAALNDAGGVLLRRYWARGALPDLEATIAYAQQAVELTPPDAPDRAGYLNNLATGLRARYARTGALPDLEAAIAYAQQAVELTPPDAPDRASRLNNLANGLSDRYARTGALPDLEAAIAYAQQAVELTPPDAPDRAGYLNNLAIGLRDRYARTGALPDLEAAIDYAQQAVALTPPDAPDRATYLNNLANGLRARYARTGALPDLEAAIDYAQQAVALTPPDAPDRASRLNNLATGLSARYARTGALPDLEAAIAHWQQAVELTPPDAPDRASRLNNLANGLSDRYARTGALPDLEAAIAHWQQALALTLPDAPNRAMYLNNLANGLRARYARTGALPDLEAAIAHWQQAVELAPPDAPDRAGYLNNLATGLRDRYARTGALPDLEAAIAHWQQALALAPPDAPDRASRLNNLANGLSDRYARTGALPDLEAAIAHWQQAVELAPPDAPDRAPMLSNLASGLRARYARTGALPDLEAAIAHWQQAVELTPPDAPDRAMHLNNLATGLRDRYASTGALPDLEAAIEHYRQACQAGLSDSVDVAVTAARAWLRWAAERHAWAEAAEAARHLRDATLAVVAAQWTRAEKANRLRDVQGLAALGAYAHAQIGQAGGAAEILEVGQARLLGEGLERDRYDLAALPAEMQARYRRAAERWQALLTQPETDIALTSAQRQMRHADRVAARAELDAAIAAIRAVPGYEDFFRPLPFERIQAQARPDRPLAYLATTAHGSAIVVVWPERVEAILNDFTEAELNALLVETDPERRNVTGGYLPAQLAIGAWLSPALARVLPALGRLMGPLAERLRAGGARGVVLIPSGRLGLLPLHAADVPSPPIPLSPEGRGGAGGEGKTHFLDLFEVSYSPSAQALREARANAERRAALAFRLAGVGNPLPNARPLAYAKPELESIVELIGLCRPGAAAAPLYEREATRPALLAALPGATTAHFSCHGNYALDEPLDSGLHLGDGALTLREILDAPAPFASVRLAVLSACQTSVTDFAQLPDEAIGLPAGLLQAGVPAVVGTLWSVEDESTALLMVRFYELMLGDGLAPCAALRAAQRWLRDVTNAELEAYVARHDALASAKREVMERMAAGLSLAIEVRVFASDDPNARPFSDPKFWAAFTFNGLSEVTP